MGSDGTITLVDLDRIVSKSRGMTGYEIEALRARCPEWLELKKKREEEHRQRVAKLRAELDPEMVPIEVALRELGYEFKNLSDFANTDQPYPDALPIFLRHLPNVRHQVLRKIIAHALTVREGRGLAGPVILNELREKQDELETRLALAHALTAAASKDDVVPMRALVADSRNADIRERLEIAIRKAPKR